MNLARVKAINSIRRKQQHFTIAFSSQTMESKTESLWEIHPGSVFIPSRILDPEVKKALDPGSVRAGNPF
jgi:hypothetical protein